VQDDPKASDLRQAMAKGTTSRRMAAFRPTAERVVNELLDVVADSPTSVDLVTALTGRYSLDVMSEPIGIPDEERESIRRWTRLLFSSRVEEGEQGTEAIHNLGGYAAQLWWSVSDSRARIC
jgi:cytochrome P450